jgi:membrane fusion protein, heavy metal efflux system
VLFDKKTILAAVAFVAILLALGHIYFARSGSDLKPAEIADAGSGSPAAKQSSGRSSTERVADETINLSDSQVEAIKIVEVGYYDFHFETTATGSLDFNQDMSVQVFTPYQGKIINLSAKVGDEVMAGQTLFTIDSSDLLQAESTLIQTAGVLDLTTRGLTRAKRLVEIGGGAQKDLEQATSDQQTAEGAFRAARNTLHIFGKNDTEIDRIAAERKIDSTLVVPSPITGVITARNAAHGLFVQPGNAPAPYTVADISTKWLNAAVSESDISALRLGQDVEAHVLAYPNKIFEGKVTTLAASVDPTTHRLLVRSEIRDPDHLLRPGMFASCVIRIGAPLRSTAIPLNGVVREGDGTMSAWITKDQRQFTKRTIQTGLQQNGYDQILRGVQPGELAVSEGAVFLSNMLTSSPTD